MRFSTVALLGIASLYVTNCIQSPERLLFDEDTEGNQVEETQENADQQQLPQQPNTRKTQSSKKQTKSSKSELNLNTIQNNEGQKNNKTGGINGLISSLFKGTSGNGEGSLNLFSNLFDQFSKVHEQFDNTMKTIFKGMFGTIEGLFGNQLKSLFGGFLSGKFGLDFLSNLLTMSTSLMNGGLNIDFCGKLMKLCLEACSGMTDQIMSQFSTLINGAINGGKKINGDTKKTLSGFLDSLQNIEEGQTNTMNQFNSIFSELLNGKEDKIIFKKLKGDIQDAAEGAKLEINDDGFVQVDWNDEQDEIWDIQQAQNQNEDDDIELGQELADTNDLQESQDAQ